LRNLKALCDLAYTEEEAAFAARIQQTLDEPQPWATVGQVYDQSGQVLKGSTDVGDVSWKVPTVGFITACWVPGTPGHSWQACAAGGTSLGRKGMGLAAKVLAATAWDLYEDPRLLAAAKAEHARRLSGRQYESLMKLNQKPPLDYRNPPKAQRAP
jgi:aminobenzoyl-glutamate utilization protein B